MAEQEAARELAEFLTRKDNYARKSFLEERVQREISTMANEIASEIVAGFPELRDIIGNQVVSLVRQCLRDDVYMSETVVTAVAKALHAYTLGGVE